ncbi:MAG: hypothetical protein JNK53_04540 [Phycisphaerae bacterium]|nr:hypothetical protein [Phycisphaerae bacterium]
MRTLALLAAVLACAAVLPACGEMKPRPAADTAAIPAAPPAERATRDPRAPDQGHNSSSTLGKARDAAMRGIRTHDQHQADVSKQADEVFKTK